MLATARRPFPNPAILIRTGLGREDANGSLRCDPENGRDPLMLFDFLIRPPFMTIPFLNGGEPRRGALLVAGLKSQRASARPFGLQASVVKNS
jgi:hypothetical protein